MKKAIIACALALGLSTSCLGPDNLYNSVKNWNAELSDTDFVNEIVYIGFMILPVYPIALFADQVLFNPITYWTGKDTISDPGAFPGFSAKD